MPRKTNNKPIPKGKSKQKTDKVYSFSVNPLEFYISEETANYVNKKPFSVYYDNPEHSIRLLKGDCVEILNQARENSVDMIFADPPYFLSNGGITCHAGKMVSVNKGKWDKSRGVVENHKFTLEWLRACQRVLKPNGTIWVSGTAHIIYSVGFAMQELSYKLLNDIIWHKYNTPLKVSHRYFTNSKEVFIWAAKNQKSKHYFDYQLMKKLNNGKQMRNLWRFTEEEETKQLDVDDSLKVFASTLSDKCLSKYTTQKPINFLKRIVLSSTKKGDLILDPFCGNSTIGIIASSLNRKYVGIKLKN